MTAILGISAFYHDSAAAIVVDGVVVAAAQEERFSHKKYDEAFPNQAIEFCLRQTGLEIEDLDHVVFYEKPFLKFERILETYLKFAPRGFNSFRTSIPIWLKSKLYISRLIYKGLGRRYRKRIVFLEHHQSHAAGAFFPSPFEQAAILTVDGAGEWATTTMGVGNGNQIEIHKQLNFPDSLGLLYSAFTYFCGFKVNGGEGKLMGLAPYGKPDYADVILDEIVDLKSDGSFRLDQSFFNYCVGNTMTSLRFEQLFDGPPRVPESAITEREKNLAASIQVVTETILLKIATQLHADTGMQNLCIAGGVGLNCVANGRLLRESPFENVWVQPAAGDSGGAIGAAFFVWHQLLENQRTKETIGEFKNTAYLGPIADPKETEKWFTDVSAPFRNFENEAELWDEVAKQLAEQKIVGWFQGRTEFGPRALGNRSILADPRDATMQDRLNRDVKFRESFRPFAPVVLADRCDEFFEVGHAQSPFMLFAGKQKEAKLDNADAENKSPAVAQLAVPAVTHVDGSARVQTLEEDDNPKLFGLLKSFDARTGCPMLVNTSFNVRGKPIVCTAEDAYRCFMETDLDLLVIGNLVLKKTDQPKLAFPKTARKISQWRKLLALWLLVTFPVRWLLANVALCLVFFLVVLPIGWFARFRKLESFQAIDGEAKTYWITRTESPEPTQYFKQY